MIVPFIAILFCLAVVSGNNATFSKDFVVAVCEQLRDSYIDEDYTDEDVDRKFGICLDLLEYERRRRDLANAEAEAEAEATNESLPLLEVENNGSYDTNDIDNSEVSVPNTEPPCTTAIKQWLGDLREYFVDWRERMEHEKKNSLLQREKSLFQLRFVKKMNDLVVSHNDVTQRDAISAYVMSLLDDDERSMLLYKLDELEGRMIRINQPFAFDFNNVMSYFLDMSKGLDEQDKARTRMNFYIEYLNKIWELPDDDDQAEVYQKMYSQLDLDEKKSLREELNMLQNELLVKFGEDEDSFSIYNTILYFKNKAEGRNEEYVSASVWKSNPSMHYRFLSTADDEGVNSSDVEVDTVVESKVDENVLRQLATKQLEFYQEVLVAAMANEDEEVLLDSAMRSVSIEMIAQLGYEERIRVENGMIEARAILLPLGEDEQYHNWHNVMTYFDNIARGTDLEYVSSSVLVDNLDMLERFLPDDYDVNDDDDKDYTSNVDDDEPLVSRIKSALMYKPHSDLDDSWTWDDLSNDMLIDVCDKTLLPLSRPDRYTRRRLIKEARECQVFQAVLYEAVAIDDLDIHFFLDFYSKDKKESIDKMISILRISEEERVELQDYIIGMLDSEDNSDSPKPMETNQPKSNSTLNKLYGLLLAITILFGPLLVYDIWMNTLNYSMLLDKYEKLHEMASDIITNTWESLYNICSVPLEIIDYIISMIRRPYELYQEARITRTIYVKSSSLNKLIGRRRRKKKELIRISGIEAMQIDAAATGSYIPVHVSGSRRSVWKAIELIQEDVGVENTELFSWLTDATSSNVTQAQVGHDNAPVESERVSDSNTLEEQHVTHNDSSDIKSIQEEEVEDSVPSEIGVDDSSQGMSHYNITGSCVFSLDDKSNVSTTHSTFKLDENDPLLIFLRSQHQCIKGSVDEFYTWLVNSEDIDSTVALKEAVCEDDYLNNKMKRGNGSSGLKGFKLSTFKRVVQEYEDNHTTPDNDKSTVPAASNTNEPPEELVCPISLVLMTNDPVVAADGITYERASIEDWFDKSKAKISEAREKLMNNQQSETYQRVVDNGICSPVYGSKLESLALMPNTVVRNMARAYIE